MCDPRALLSMTMSYASRPCCSAGAQCQCEPFRTCARGLRALGAMGGAGIDKMVAHRGGRLLEGVPGQELPMMCGRPALDAADEDDEDSSSLAPVQQSVVSGSSAPSAARRRALAPRRAASAARAPSDLDMDAFLAAAWSDDEVVLADFTCHEDTLDASDNDAEDVDKEAPAAVPATGRRRRRWERRRRSRASLRPRVSMAAAAPGRWHRRRSEGSRRSRADVDAACLRRQSGASFAEEEGEEAFGGRGCVVEEDCLVVPPCSDAWDWPMSRLEKKARIISLDREMLLLDRRELKKQLCELWSLIPDPEKGKRRSSEARAA
eukprot:TRINITY_DN11315_c0_g1_i1.p1 TRINITY_DN11315_c0_g1~~TRINITY_DN11315_c0_g1_i1.p1  ORF type:complete len:337 (-),score=83.54 TRINITY_DN11315_c0_g1_i1:82-1044(-)